VQETHLKGASVATVARRHDVNPNMVLAPCAESSETV
jgi:transposase-like protein